MEFTNLFMGYNKAEDFRVLVCAFCEDEAKELLKDYSKDSGLSDEWEISETGDLKKLNVNFDCDYIIA